MTKEKLRYAGVGCSKDGSRQVTDVYWKGKHIYTITETHQPFFGKKGVLAAALGVAGAEIWDTPKVLIRSSIPWDGSQEQKDAGGFPVDCHYDDQAYLCFDDELKYVKYVKPRGIDYDEFKQEYEKVGERGGHQDPDGDG